jgi:hypothetical protein
MLPDHPPLAVQLLAPVASQSIEAVCPAAMLEGVAFRISAPPSADEKAAAFLPPSN